MRWNGFRAGLSTENKNERQARRQKAERLHGDRTADPVFGSGSGPRCGPGWVPGRLPCLALFGFFRILPGAVHAVVAAGFFGAPVFASGARSRAFAAPGWGEGARRVERDSNLPNRPITEAEPISSPRARAIRCPKTCGACTSSGCSPRPRHLRLHCPRRALASAIRYGLRFAVLLGVIAGFVFARPQCWPAPASGFRRSSPAPSQSGLRRLGLAALLYRPAAAFADRHHATTMRDFRHRINSTLVMPLRGTESQPTLHIASDAQPRAAGLQTHRLGYESHLAGTRHGVSVQLGVAQLGDMELSNSSRPRARHRLYRAAVGEQHQALKLSYQRQRRLRRRQGSKPIIVPLDESAKRRRQNGTLVDCRVARLRHGRLPRRSFAISPHTPMRG